MDEPKKLTPREEFALKMKLEEEERKMREEMEGPRLMGSVPAPEFLRDGGNPFPMGVMNLDVRNLQQPPQPIDADTPTTTCPACNSTVPAKKFCIECGAKL